MPIIASDKGGSDFEPIPAGSHQAVCYGVVDLGTQMSNNPQFADARKVCILWELPQERGKFKDKEDQSKMVDRPRAISAVYTLSLGTKANLRKVLESWRAKQFTEDELKGFDIGTPGRPSPTWPGFLLCPGGCPRRPWRTRSSCSPSATFRAAR
jgi:hypothetical protein